MRLYIVTGVHEPYFQFIPALYKSIIESEPHGWEVRWWLGIQNKEIDPCGVRKQNEALDTITDMDAWIYTFAADSILHPSFLRRTYEVIANNESVRAVIVNQRRSQFGGFLIAAPEYMIPCHVSGDNVLIRRDLYADKRWSWDMYGGTCDGHMIQQLYQDHPEAFLFLQEELSWFNRQRW